ncbi:MAG: serine/threonine-protein kinase, partial [Pirellulales bacterium]
MAGAIVDAKQIFFAALDCESPDEVASYLASACGGDAALRARVELLLAARREAGSFLGGADTGPLQTGGHLGTVAGSNIGPYKLLQQIGEGGFGAVFLAEQERPVKRRVALKVVKPGMDTREVIARFEAERQALALMDHPNIAKVYDAGATVEGRPYFVMELVHGVPITEYCDECQLPTRTRLELFGTVCRAVQHAHQKGIIHRDLKPTNVLVAIQDGQPTPKIIDFGVAKAINQQLTEHTLMTAFAQILGTPLYMSPEQAELSPLGVDTRSDIYSLGVLLYELLTGTTPFDKQRFRTSSYDELRRIIREEEPPRPSARISTLSADAVTTLAERRRTDRRRLQQTVRGELDWIVMKCLEKDRNRRYETANGLARDIERYLSDEPVTACPPSVSYRFGKFARRNKVALAAAAAGAAVLLMVLVGLAASNRMIAAERTQADEQRQIAQEKAAEEERASQLAKAEATKANEVVALMQDMLSAAHPDSADGKNFTVRELLDEFSTGLGERLSDQPEVEATLRQIIGSAYTR